MANGKERPILFSAPMVRAILDGKKTQTRRLVGLDTMRRSDTPGYDWTWRGQAPIRSIAQQRRHPSGCWQDVSNELLLSLCPYGVPGDRLWVKESYRLRLDQDAKKPSDDWWKSGAWYAADGSTPSGCGGGPGKLRPSIHMPRWASRITLEIKSVRVEQLQDISEEDAKAEGCPGFDPEPADEGGTIYAWKGRSSAPSPRAHFAGLWDSINHDRAPWASNPWVWRVEFARVELLHEKR